FSRHAERVVARLYHRIECFSLMCGVAAERVDQIGNEISAPLELYVYPGPTFFGQLPRAHEAVVQMNEITNRQNQNGEDDEKYFHEIYSVVLNGAVSGSSGIAFSRKDFFQPALGTSHCRAFDIHGLVRNAVLCCGRTQAQIEASGELLMSPVFADDVDGDRNAVAKGAHRNVLDF